MKKYISHSDEGYSSKTMNSDLTDKAQNLRKNMTPEEKQLWYQFLKKYPVTFNRQKVIGNYIVDFYCASAKLAIELDGSQHMTERGQRHDTVRTDYLVKLGIEVLRYPNSRVTNDWSAVCEDISQHITERLNRQNQDSYSIY